MKKNIMVLILIMVLTGCGLSGCTLVENEVNELNGTITGNTYNASFYTNAGEKFMDMSGEKN